MATRPPESSDDAPESSRRARREADAQRAAAAAAAPSPAEPAGEPSVAADADQPLAPGAGAQNGAWPAEYNPFAGLGFQADADANGTAPHPSAAEPAVPAGVAAARPASAAAPSNPAGVVPKAGRARSNRADRRAQLSTEPPREKRSRKGGWGCLVVLVVLVGLMAAGAYALQGPINQLVAMTQGPEDYEGSGSGEVLVMIHEGETGGDIAQTLLDRDVVKSYDAFYDLLLSQPSDPVFQPGAYLVASQMSASAALAALVDPESRQEQTVVIPEGTAAVDVLSSISEGTEIPLEELQAAAADVSAFGLPAEATTLEGFLFPATYTFAPGVTAFDAIKTLVDRQFQALDEAGVAPADRWKTIVMASLIQREAGLRDDYYKVSRVFYNRLDPAQWETGTLESDATVAYGTGNTHLVTTTDAERQDAGNAYNTYLHPGLPVGPISNPGDLAIDATLHPADGPWLFFVTWNLDTGETIFSSTVDEHDAGVAKWLAWMKDHPEYG